MAEQDKAAAGAVVAEREAPAPSREQIITEIAEASGASAQQARAWRESAKTVAQVSAEAFAQVAQRSGHADAGQIPAPVDVTLSPREQREYSLVRALNQLVNGKRSGLEFEVSATVAKQLGRDTEGFFLPTHAVAAQNPAARSAAEGAALQGRTQLSVGQAGKGAEAKFTEYGGFIDLLRARMVCAAMGAQLLSGLQGDLSFVGQSGTGTFTWGTETANAALSSLSTSLRTMAPKIGQSATTLTRQLLRQSVFDVENLVRNDIATIHALGIDAAGLAGPGTGSQPRGVLNTAGIGSVVGGTNGAQPTWDHVVDLQKEVAIDNALAGSLGYAVHPLIAARLMKTQQFSGTNGAPIWSGNILDGTVAGFRAMASTQIASGQTKGTSTDCSPVIFGDFSALIFGEWGAMEMLVDPYTLGPAIVKLASIQMLDVFVRYPEKFAAMADARA